MNLPEKEKEKERIKKMAKTQERIKTDYKAMEESRGMVQQCSACDIRYRSHEVQTLCSDCEEQQEATQTVETIEEEVTATMNIQDAKASDLTDTTGAAALLDCSIETIRQLVIQKKLRCFCFVDGTLQEAWAKGKSAIFLREDIEALPPRVHGWPAGKARKKEG